MEENLPQLQVPVSPVPPPPPKRFPLKWLIIIALLVGIVLAGIYLIFKSQSNKQIPQLTPQAFIQPTVSSTSAPIPDETANWKIYTNSKYQFSIFYPDNLSTREEPHDFLGTQIYFFDDKEATSSGIKVSAIVYDKALGKTIDQDFDTLYALSSDTSKTITNSVVGSIKLTKVQNRIVGRQLAFDYIRNSLPIDPANPEVGVGIYIDLGTNVLILEVAEADRNLLEQMLGTFKLLDISSFPTPILQGAFCGGIAGKTCPEGYKCQLDGSYPDAGGKCVKK